MGKHPKNSLHFRKLCITISLKCTLNFHKSIPFMRGSGRFFRGGSKYHYKRDTIGPPAKRQIACRCWPNIECWIVSFVVLQGIRTNIAKRPYIFVIFQRGGGGSGPPVPPLDPHMPFPFIYLADIP